MKATNVAKEGNLVTLTMDFTAEELEQAKIKVYQANKGKFQIDGFRKGKAPRSIIEKHYGEGIFEEDAINDLLSLNYGKAIDELELKVIAAPQNVEVAPREKDEDLKVTVKVEVYPDIEVKDYKGVEVEEEPLTITAEDVDAEMESIRHKYARLISVDRPVKEGDSIILDYKGFIGDEQFDGGTAEGFSLKIGSGTFIPGFEDQLVGAEKDKEVDVKVTFPEEYHAENLAGKEAVFKCLVHDVKEEELPELDDEFAKDASEFDTLKEFREFTEGRLMSQREEVAQNIMKDSILDKVFDANDFDVPDAMVEDEINGMMQEYDQQLRQQGMDLASYMQYMNRTPEEFKDDMKISAFRRVKNRMILTGIADQENLEATEEDVQAQLEKMAEQFHLELDKLKEMLGDENFDFLKSDVRLQKATDFLLENAKKVPKKEKKEDKDAKKADKED